MFANFLENLPILRQLLAAPDSRKYNLLEEQRLKIFSEEFLSKVKKEKIKLEPLCKFIDVAQADSCSLGRALHEWLRIEKPTDNYLLNKHKKRESYIKHQNSIFSYVLTPSLRGELLTLNEKNGAIFAIQSLISNNDASWTELNVVEEYIETKGVFKMDALLKLENDPKNYWSLVKRKFPLLGEIGHKFCSLPSGTAELERLFSGASYIHNKIRNRLKDDRSEKLLLIYNTLRFEMKEKEDDTMFEDFDDDDDEDMQNMDP